MVNLQQAHQDVLVARRASGISTRAQLHSAIPAPTGYLRLRFGADAFQLVATTWPADALKVFFPVGARTLAGGPSYDAAGRARWPRGVHAEARALTVGSWDRAHGTVDILYDNSHGGVIAEWVARAQPGDQVWVVGVRTDFVEARDASQHLVVCDRSSLPAATSIVESLSQPTQAQLLVLGSDMASEILRSAGARVQTFVDSGALLSFVQSDLIVETETQFWLGGEESYIREIRRVLLDQRGVDQRSLFAAPYWSTGQTWEELFDQQLDRSIAAADRGLDLTDPVVLQQLAFNPSTDS